MPDVNVVTPVAVVPSDRLALGTCSARWTDTTMSAFCSPAHVSGACYCTAEE